MFTVRMVMTGSNKSDKFRPQVDEYNPFVVVTDSDNRFVCGNEVSAEFRWWMNSRCGAASRSQFEYGYVFEWNVPDTMVETVKKEMKRKSVFMTYVEGVF